MRKVFLLLFLSAAPTLLQRQGPAPCVRGQASAPIRLEVFSDYQCPACRAFYLQTVRQIFTNYADTGKVCVVYHSYLNFDYSRAAARFAHAAFRIGAKQWGAVTDALFEKQPQWAETGEVESVVAAALSPQDMQAVQKLVESKEVDASIDKDVKLSIDRDVISTPTFFVTFKGQTEKVEAALTYASMQRRFDELLK
jgi:protein-disulfide isomerase